MFQKYRFVPILLGLIVMASSFATHADPVPDREIFASKAYTDTKVSSTQSTGYQVLTTGTTGTVTADYLQVPVTTSGTGRPTANNAPSSTAAIWIE